MSTRALRQEARWNRARGRRACALLVFAGALFPAGRAPAACGDLTGDNRVVASDALACLRGAVALDDIGAACTPSDTCGPFPPLCGDINRDGAVRASDCLAILQAGVGSRDIAAACDCQGLGRCGNGAVETEEGEQCDDGNREGGDGCSFLCRNEVAEPCEGIAPVAGTDLRTRFVADVGSGVTDIAAAPGEAGRLFVALQDGVVRIVENDLVLDEPLIDLGDAIAFLDNESGLLGMAFHPDPAANGRFFVNYTDLAGDTVISRFELDPLTGLADRASEKKLLVVAQIDPFHNGGQIVFGPDGYLWVALGDGNGNPGGDRAGAAQDDGSLLGKMLRLDIDVEEEPFWAVPPDNPDPEAEGALALIWAEGLRNPWRFSFDRASGDLWVADVGQSTVEELNRIASGDLGKAPFQFGWNCCEGSNRFSGAGPECVYSCSEAVVPRRQFFHGGSPRFCSITGGFVYRGCSMPDLAGSYFFADFCFGHIREDSGGPATLDRTAALAPGGGRAISLPSTFGQDLRGELYIADYADGEIFKIVPAP